MVVAVDHSEKKLLVRGSRGLWAQAGARDDLGSDVLGWLRDVNISRSDPVYYGIMFCPAVMGRPKPPYHLPTCFCRL